MMSIAQASTIWPAIWSAVAASASALCAVVILWTHSRNSRDSVRPEIVLSEPTLELTEGFERYSTLKFSSIVNHGKGHALHVCAFADQHPKPGPEQPCLFVLERIPILSADGQSRDVDGRVVFWFRPQERDFAYALLKLRVFAIDLHGRQHETIFEYMSQRSSGIQRHVAHVRRHTKIRSGFRVRVVGHAKVLRDQMQKEFLPRLAERKDKPR